MELESGTLLHGRYRIEETLGKGGMGAVYRAVDESLGMQVAVKENLLEDEEAIRQFRREATILAGLRHPNLPRVTDHYVVPDGGQYLVMDFIAGEDLKMRLQRTGAISEKEVLLIGIAITDALAYLHNLTPPVLHRDIKPGNIRIAPDGHVYLVDFGLAKIEQGGQATTTGARGLTPGYSPPEQYGTARTDARSDVYSLGATLYTALTGFPPEDGLSVAINQSTLTPVRERNASVAHELAVIIETALNNSAEDRYQTALEFKQKLLEASETVNRQVATGEVTVAPPPQGATVVSVGETLPRADSQPPPIHPPSIRPPGVQNRRGWLFALIGIVGVIAVLVVAGIILAPRLFPGMFGGDDGVTPIAQAATDTPEQDDDGDSVVVDDPVEDEPTATLQPTFTLAPTDTPLPTFTSIPAETPTGGGGMIAYASHPYPFVRGETQIWLYDIASGERTQLTREPEGACQPTWSPDGMRLAYITPCHENLAVYDNSSLYLINIDGTDRAIVPGSAIGDYDPAWSPKENKILFTTVRGNNRQQIWVVNLDNSKSRNVYDRVAQFFTPSWSPDGNKILFSSNMDIGRGKIWIMDINGENLKEFSHSDDRTNVEPIWSPNWNIIVYTQFGIRGGGVPNLMFAYYDEDDDQSGRIENRVSLNNLGMREPDFSPDGSWLVFAGGDAPEKLDIYIMHANGLDLTKLTDETTQNFDPAWRPVP